ncbi:MAG: NAD-dependent protein deacylase [Dehalococcoidales bacterium]
MNNQDLEILADKVADLIVNAKRVVVFTGAGISTESGIPDFRSPGGIWERFDPDDFTYQKFVSNPDSRRKQWQMFRERRLIGEAKPNLAHYAIAELDKLGKLDCVITQNVDNLHQKAGVPADKIFELHGNMQWIICLSCGRRYAFEQIKTRLDKGEEIPDCEACHGILKPDVVLFGESLPEEVLKEATFRSSGCDLLIVIGSTLIVYPAAYMPMYAYEAGAKLVIINLSSTPMDHQATVLIRAKAGETMAKVVKRVKEKSASPGSEHGTSQ